jgi:hypothetical protein
MHRTSGAFAYGIYAFADTGAPAAGMANIRMHNADPIVLAETFTADLNTFTTPLGSGVAPGGATAMVALPPGEYLFGVPNPPNGTTLASPSPTTAAGTWDGFAYARPGGTGLVVCPATAAPKVACALGN